MTINVRSNEKPAPEAPKAEAPVEQAQESNEKTLSALDEKTSEQNESKESETLETEAKEGDEQESEESESKEETEAKDEKPELKDKPKKKSGFQKRVDKLNARIADREQEIEYWKREALKSATGAKSDVAIETTKPAAAEGKPKAEDFESHAEYVEALTEWKTEQKLKERDQKLEKTKLEIEQAKLVNTYAERRKAFAEKTQDFEDVIGEVDDVPVSPAVRDIIVTSENGPELAYELAKHREEFERICKLPPIAAAREMGRFEARYLTKTSDGKTEAKKISKAPQPIAPVGTGGKGSAPKSIYDADKMSQSEYERMRMEQIKKRRQAS